MGAIHFSLDPDLARFLASSLQLKTFVETGTFQGESAEMARSIFETVHTCELSEELHQAALKKFENAPEVHCHLGDSGALLRDIRTKLGDTPALFWLDAHWCEAKDTAGAESQCPLLEELRAIAPLHPDSIVWIDDARYFTAPPPAPLVKRGWPTFHEVNQALLKLADGRHRITFPDDTIMLYPERIEEDLLDYLHHHAADWLKISHEAHVVVPHLRERLDSIRRKKGLKRLLPWKRSK